MSVFINGRFLTQRLSGMQRYAEQIVLALDENLHRNYPPEVLSPMILVHPPGRLRSLPLKRIQTREIGQHKGHLWEQSDLWSISKNGLLLNLLSSGPLLHGRQISTFHDAAVFRYPQLFNRGYATMHKMLRPILARRSKALLTVSRFSAGELSDCLNMSPADFTIVPNAADHITRLSSDENILRRHGLEPGQFGLCVGNQTPNKNVATAIAAFERLDDPTLKLVLVGAGDARIFGDYQMQNQSRVVPAGYVTDQELRALYENARFLCFPSRYEGFGIPAIEAMALGCPVIASNSAAVPETCGEAAVLVDPDDINGFASAMANVSTNDSLAADLVRKGRSRAQDFSWDLSASVLIQLLIKLDSGTT